MKASIAATIIALLGGSTAWAQISPAYNNLMPSSSSVAAPPPAMPEAPIYMNYQQSTGTQLPGSGVPMPPLPVIPQAAPPAPHNPYAPVDLNAPYNEPFAYPPVNEFPAIGPALAPQAISGPNYWLSADYLFWWVKRGPQPYPLVVTGPSTDPYPGALDQPNTKVLYGGQGFSYDPFSGSRVSIGTWLGSDSRYGFEMGGMILEQKSTQFAASGGTTGNPFLARPFVDALAGYDNVYFVSQNFADPTRTALMTGGVEISSSSRLWAWDINGLYNFYRGSSFAANLIAGFSSVGLRENLTFGESLRNIAPGGGVSYLGVPVDPSIPVSTSDKFDTENTFYGGQLGARVHFQTGNFGLDFTGKAAAGVMQEIVDIEGFTALGGPNNKFLAITPGGVYAVSSNIGDHFQQHFAVVPQGNIDLTYNITNNITFKLGYTFIYLNRVARPGNEVDGTINPGLVPTDFTFGTPGGPARPGFLFNTSSFWAQGASIGIEVRY